MWSPQLSPFLLALVATTCTGSPVNGGIIPTIPSLTITPTLLNASAHPFPFPTTNSSHVTRRTPLPLPTTRDTTSSSDNSSTSVIPHTHTHSAVPPPVARGDIHSGITTATLYSDGHAYTITQYSEVNPELSTIGLTTTIQDGTVVTTAATLPVISGTSGTGSPWQTSVTSTTRWSEDPWPNSVSVGLPTITTVVR